VESAALLRLSFGPGRLAGTAIVAGTGGVLWVVTQNPVLTTVSALLALGLSALWIGTDKARRRAVTQRRHETDSRREGYIAEIKTHLDLDRRIRTAVGSDEDHGNIGSWQIRRTPMAHGRGSRFINHVRLATSGCTTCELVEKGVDGDSDELLFWRTVHADALALWGSSYRALAPTDIAQGDPVSVMYFPYLPALDRETAVLRRDFGANLTAIVASVAEFNGRNGLPRPGLSDAPRFPFPPRPSVAELRLRMNVSAECADDLLRSVDRVRNDWPIIGDAYSNLPRCLCHNDISPGNAVHVDGIMTLSDFGLASAGPIGSDLHTIIRWSAGKMYEPDHVEGLMTTYVEAIKPYHSTVSVAEVRLAAWTTFYLRYTNLKFSSARYERPFRFALEQMAYLIGTIEDRVGDSR
jgi:hypothetical protein